MDEPKREETKLGTVIKLDKAHPLYRSAALAFDEMTAFQRQVERMAHEVAARQGEMWEMIRTMLPDADWKTVGWSFRPIEGEIVATVRAKDYEAPMYFRTLREMLKEEDKS